MEFTASELDNGVAVVGLSGRLNMVTAPRMREIIVEAIETGHQRVVVDLTEVEFMDSSGLNSLINGLNLAREAGGDLRIAGPNEQVELVLRLTNMDRVLAAYATPELAFENE